jgi:hypothetical protein
MDANNQGEGWVLKAPYVQNQVGFHIRTIQTTDEIEDLISRRLYDCSQRSSNKALLAPANIFEYLILQPKMKKNNESKVILYNGKAKYITSTSTSGLSKSHKKEELFAFAEEAWRHLCMRTEGAFLSDGLTRVDIFCNNFGNLVVNEFESLDAQYSKFGGTSEAETKTFLEGYYFDKLDSIVKAVLNSY